MIKKLLQKKSNKNKDSNSNNGSKLTTKNRIKSFFHIGRKTVDHRSEIVDLDEFPNIELEKLKTDLKSSTIRDQANKWIDQLLDKGISGMETELNNLNKSKERINTAAFDANIDRNFNQVKKAFCTDNLQAVLLEKFFHKHPYLTLYNFNKVICRDENRVILEGEENNYIHANYISTPNFTKHFICTQRPMETTTELFYKMLLQEQVVSIVMLCSLTENTEKNCPAYFPQKPTEKSMKFGCITVKCLNTEEMKNEPGIVVTALEIQDIDSQDLVVRHYYCRNWSERSFPDPACCIFTLLCAVRSSKKPIIVHCSDGYHICNFYLTHFYDHV
ncbi:unnamed protein product [Thelazia callipaeda]|uniref:Tyrosine-protein phosphatase domain-containing protein n=1 Tax=Thelazia callipaeda TaxID=103827 RepID=A0A0N5CY54_THECL|nr:unnamed protein product [Thelazia callipaeda]